MGRQWAGSGQVVGRQGKQEASRQWADGEGGRQWAGSGQTGEEAGSGAGGSGQQAGQGGGRQTDRQWEWAASRLGRQADSKHAEEEAGE